MRLYVHPLYRFDLAMAVLSNRPSLVTRGEIDALPAGILLAPTIHAYCDLVAVRMAERLRNNPGETWPLPDVNTTLGTMTASAPHWRHFSIVLSWGHDGWQLRTRGKLADRNGPPACAIRWLTGRLSRGDKQRLRDSLDFFTRVTATLMIFGVDSNLLVTLPAARFSDAVTSAVSLMIRESGADKLFRRALASCHPALFALA